MSEKTRYSDAELEEFRSLIVEKLEVAQRDYELLKANVANMDGNDTSDTSPTFKIMEEGAVTMSKEEAGRLAQRQMKFIQHLQAALVRIENKTYGICRETGRLIPKERLRAVPHATLCIDAKNNGANTLIRGLRNAVDFEYEKQLMHINNELNKNIKTIFIISKPEFNHISSSAVKEIYANNGDYSKFVPNSVYNYLNSKCGDT